MTINPQQQQTIQNGLKEFPTPSRFMAVSKEGQKSQALVMSLGKKGTLGSTRLKDDNHSFLDTSFMRAVINAPKANTLSAPTSQQISGPPVATANSPSAPSLK